MGNAIKPNPLSFRSLFVQAYSGESELGIASAFVWREADQDYLITNWHVASGLHPETRQSTHNSGATPDFLRVWFHLTDRLGNWEAHDLPLLNNQGRPLWKEHAAHGGRVDVVAIKLSLPEKYVVYPINTLQFDDFRIEISQEVFIIGFPRSLTGGGRFPIWKKGSIASEPEIDLQGLPMILVDSATREGMSGSPAIAQLVGFIGDDPENPKPTDGFGMARRLLGIYSGRLSSKDELEAQLGLVWKESAIAEIVQNGVRPK